MITTLIVLGIWTLLAVVFGFFIGRGTRIADEMEQPEAAAAADRGIAA